MKKIILVGKAASGKDYFKDFLFSKGLKTSISHTTRPMRDGEENGKTYYFISDLVFSAAVQEGEFFEFKKFNDWYYGTSNEEIKKGEVFIFTPSGIKDLPESFKKDCIIVYFDVKEHIRIERLKKRSDSDKIQRRIEADKKDFENFNDFNIRITDHKFNSEKIFKRIENLSS